MATKRFSILILLSVFFVLLSLPNSIHAQLRVWANDGGDKITQDELRATTDAVGVVNSVWDGDKITVFGARNEVVSFNLIIEAPSVAANDVVVSFDRLRGPGGAAIVSKTVSGNGVFNWTDRPIELFHIRYLEIKGLSHLSYNALYDERHVPDRFRRPWTDEGDATGTWEDRPDHNKGYPEIAVPLELISHFNISAGRNQSIWVDIFISKSTPAGLYEGTLTVGQAGSANQTIAVELTVRGFTLPDYPSAPTMLYYSDYNINYRYLGANYIDPSSDDYKKSINLIDLHFQLAHRHKISLIDEYFEIERMAEVWTDRLSGGTPLFENCNECQKVRQSLLPFCEHCGNEKNL